MEERDATNSSQCDQDNRNLHFSHEVVPANNIERHVEGLSRAATILAKNNAFLSTSLLATADTELHPDRAKEIAALHQQVLQMHVSFFENILIFLFIVVFCILFKVGFIMHLGNEDKLTELEEKLSGLSERDMELSWFWFKGAISGCVFKRTQKN